MTTSLTSVVWESTPFGDRTKTTHYEDPIHAGQVWQFEYTKRVAGEPSTNTRVVHVAEVREDHILGMDLAIGLMRTFLFVGIDHAVQLTDGLAAWLLEQMEVHA